jgi:hypothetical protein
VEPKLDAGAVTLTVTRNAQVTTVDIVFTACGAFTVTRSAVSI